MLFIPQKVVKGQALVDLLVAHPVSKSSKLHEDIPDEFFESNITSEDEVWQMFFDGALRIGPKGKIITGMGVVYISSQNHVLPRTFSLMESCFNNVAEYMLYSLAFNSPMKWGYAILRLMVIPN